jgi:hypothetical protein
MVFIIMIDIGELNEGEHRERRRRFASLLANMLIIIMIIIFFFFIIIGRRHVRAERRKLGILPLSVGLAGGLQLPVLAAVRGSCHHH